MCPKDIHKGKDAKTYSNCLTNLEEGQQCKPECVKWHQIMETSYAADTGFYFKFESDSVTGKPSGCPGLDKEWEDGWGFSKFSKIFKNNLKKSRLTSINGAKAKFTCP